MESEVVKAAPVAKVDERAAEMFEALGITHIPDGLVRAYKDFKRVKDAIQPGPLTAEGYAAVLAIYRLRRELTDEV